MNIWQAYEELKGALGPEASQKVAHVLDALIQEHVRTEVRDATEPLARALQELATEQARTEQQLQRLAQKVEELAEAQTRTEQRLEELAEAQRRTDERLETLAVRVDQLAEAQRRTEQRLEELAEAQRRTDERLEALAVRVDQLAEAQKRTEQRLEELAEAQKRTEQRLEELAEAQRQTEQRVQTLAIRLDQLAEALQETRERLDETNRQLGGLSATVGYTLENAAYRALPALLERDHRVRVLEKIRRDFLTDSEGRNLEVNILARAEQDGQPVWIVGESKTQLSCNDVDRFLRRRLERLQPVLGRVFPVLVTHMISGPEVRTYAQSKGVALYLSFEFDA